MKKSYHFAGRNHIPKLYYLAVLGDKNRNHFLTGKNCKKYNLYRGGCMEKTVESEIIGNNLRNIRHIRGLSVEDLSKIIGWTPDTIRKYERGERALSVSDMVRFSKILRCNPQNFIRGLDGGEQNKKEIGYLNAYQHDVFVRVATEFNGNKDALISAIDLYTRLSPARRREIIMAMEVQKDEAAKNGEIILDDLPEEVHQMQEQLAKLYEL